MNTNFEVKVQGDHLEKLAKCQPVKAVAELIWNAVDADATEVVVSLERSIVGGVNRITIADDGHGINPDEALQVFEKLGGSWKKLRITTRSNRLLHGKAGEGRFRAFALGPRVHWTSASLHQGRICEICLKGQRNSRVFNLDRVAETVATLPGTTVTIDEVYPSAGPDLVRADAILRLSQEFALYLRNYNNVTITFDGAVVDPSKVELRSKDFALGEFEVEPGKAIQASLTLIEWTRDMGRALVLCDEGGFALASREAGIQAPGFHFTAYLRSPYLAELRDRGLLEAQDFNPGLPRLLEAARDVMRDYFRERAAERAHEAVKRWVDDEVYPFSGAATSPVESVERQVFDICALNVTEHLPSFERSDKKQKRLAFRLLRQAIEMNPGSLQTILVEVLGLPREKQDDLAELLKQTTLSAVINAAKIVSERLEFLRGLEELLFAKESKPHLLERTQLHRMLVDNTWLFGEEFSLTADDEGLTTVLKKHLALSNRDPEILEPVLRGDGSVGIVDLMVSRVLYEPHTRNREHLVIELKRPTQKIDAQVITQIKSYAFAVAGDERFRDGTTSWRFIAVSNQLDDFAERTATERGVPGLIHDDPRQPIKVWVYTWAQIIQSARARLEFFREKLDYEANKESSRQHLEKFYERFLPSATPAERPKTRKKGAGPRKRASAAET